MVRKISAGGPQLCYMGKYAAWVTHLRWVSLLNEIQEVFNRPSVPTHRLGLKKIQYFGSSFFIPMQHVKNACQCTSTQLHLAHANLKIPWAQPPRFPLPKAAGVYYPPK